MGMEQLRIGMTWGQRGRGGLWRHWHTPGGRSLVVAGADIDEGHLARFRTEHGGELYTAADYRRLLDRKDIDAIAVTSPDNFHQEHAVAALQAGKHVFCEKPLAISVDGCDDILRAWRESGRHLMVGLNMRYMAMFRTMKEIVDSGAIGDVKAVWVRHFVGLGSDFYFHDWHARRDNTFSLLLQKGSHDIDMIHWITGRYTRRVAAFAGWTCSVAPPNDLTAPSARARRLVKCHCAGSRVQCAFGARSTSRTNQI